MYATVIADDLLTLTRHFGYDLEIREHGESFDLYLIYPTYTTNEPYRILTFSNEFTREEMLQDSSAEKRILEILERNKGVRLAKVK